MKFVLTHHSGSGAPEDALELLWERLEGRRYEDVSFSRSGSEITARTSKEASISMERGESEEIARLTVLDCLTTVCERVPELKIEWYAISLRR